MTIYDEIAEKIVALREKKDFTQEGLAFECGISPSYLRRIEHGRANPTIGELVLISGALDAKLEILFTAVETVGNAQ